MGFLKKNRFYFIRSGIFKWVFKSGTCRKLWAYTFIVLSAAQYSQLIRICIQYVQNACEKWTVLREYIEMACIEHLLCKWTDSTDV